MKIGYLMQAGVADIRKYPLSGPALHVKQVLVEFKNLGHQVRLLTFIDGKIWKTDDLNLFTPVSVRWLEGPFRIFEKAIRRVQYELRFPYIAFFDSMRFAQVCLQELVDFELFYERMGWMGLGGGMAARRMRIPLILEVNGDHLSEMEMLGIAPQGLQRKLSILLMKRALLRASHLVATGEGWRQCMLERWRLKPDKVSVIENGSEIVDLLSRDQLRSFAPPVDILDGTKILYMGAFEPWHGIPVLLRAIAKAISKGADVRLVLVGSGSQQGTIEKLIKELEIGNHVILTGQLAPQQFALHLAKADIGVSPYCGRVEYSGLKLLDYKAAGLATIASGEKGQPTVIEHGRTGWIVPPCDEDALCQAIIQLVNNVELRREIGRRARIDAENCHSWRHTADQLVELFSRVRAP